jgi:hypothetical protein
MKLKDLIPEDVAAKNIPSDVKMLKKGKDGNKQIQQYSSRIDTAAEFDGAFAVWFDDLGYEPGKITKSLILTKVRDYLDSKGYK